MSMFIKIIRVGLFITFNTKRQHNIQVPFIALPLFLSMSSTFAPNNKQLCPPESMEECAHNDSDRMNA